MSTTHAQPLQLTDVSLRVRGSGSAFVALSNVSLELSEGEFVALTGPSGSGKSVLLSWLSGQTNRRVKRLSGSASAWGSSLPLSRRAQREWGGRVSFLSPESWEQLPSSELVIDVMCEHVSAKTPRSAEGVPERAAECIDQMGLPLNTLNRRIYELSSGQRQRVAMATELMTDPDLLIWDSPDAALDVSAKTQLLPIFSRPGRTSLIVSSNVHLWSHADRVAVLGSGSLVALGTLDELRTAVSLPKYVADVLSLSKES